MTTRERHRMSEPDGYLAMAERSRSLRARLASLTRSLDVYWGDAARHNAMDRLYARFIQPGDLAFDIGAHVGDRVGAFRRLGARVVAVEPQRDCADIIRAIFEGDGNVTLIESACGAAMRSMELRINTANATVATLSDRFVAAADGAAGWEGEVWDQKSIVDVTTVDALIATYGRPAFVKIDVEGFEAEVLAGLSSPLPALSFEFTTIQRDVAYDCIERLSVLGDYRFNVALGESQTLAFDEAISATQMREHILALPHSANSGDVYATAAA